MNKYEIDRLFTVTGNPNDCILNSELRKIHINSRMNITFLQFKNQLKEKGAKDHRNNKGRALRGVISTNESFIYSTNLYNYDLPFHPCG